MTEPITPTIEDYLGLIYIMQREGQVVIGARLAERLGVSRPTVTVTLKRMVRDGLVQLNRRKEISLTPSGLEAAQALLRRHMLTEWLLGEVLGLPWHQIHEEAHRLEHHFSDEATTRLAVLFEQPEACPHGNPMPGTAPPQTIALAEVPEGESAIIVRIVEEAEDQRELLAFLEKNNLLPGVQIRVLDHQPYNETVTVEIADDLGVLNVRPIVLGLATARFIQVQQGVKEPRRSERS